MIRPTTRYTPLLASLLAIAGCAMYEIDRPAPLREGAPPPVPVEAMQSAANTPAIAPAIDAPEEAVPPAEATGAHAAVPPPKPIVDAMPVSRDGAIITALANNRTLEVAGYGPRIAETFVPEARAQFDPNLMATLSYGRRTEQLGGVTRFTFNTAGSGAGAQTMLQGATPRETVQNVISALTEALQQRQAPTALDSYNSNGEVTVTNYFPTGTSVFLSGGMTRQETNFFDAQYTGSWSVGVTQALLQGFGRAVNLIALKQARNEALASGYSLEGAVLDVITQVERAYWDLALAQEVLGIREFAVTLAEEQLDFNEDLFEVGRAVEADVLSAEAERASRMADLHEAQGNLRAAGIELMRLLNPEGRPDWDIQLAPLDPPEVGEIEVVPEASVALAEAYRPELRQQELALANRMLDVEARKNERLPTLDLSATYGRTSLGGTVGGGITYLEDPDYDNYNIGLEFQTPILNRAEDARLTRARLAEERAETDLARIEHDITAQVRTAAIEVDKQWLRIGATEEAVASRLEELRIERDRYQAGRATNLDVLLVQRLLIQSQVDAASARVRYIQALTNLYAAEGTLPARRGVVLTETE